MRVSLSMVYLCMALAGSVQSMRYGCVSVSYINYCMIVTAQLRQRQTHMKEAT